MKPTATPRLVNQGNRGPGYILLWEAKDERLIYLRHAPKIYDHIAYPMIGYHVELALKGRFLFRPEGWSTQRQRHDVMQWARRIGLSPKARRYIIQLLHEPDLFLPERVRYEAAFPGGTL